jgi:hypothetical protein
MIHTDPAFFSADRTSDFVDPFAGYTVIIIGIADPKDV